MNGPVTYCSYRLLTHDLNTNLIIVLCKQNKQYRFVGVYPIIFTIQQLDKSIKLYLLIQLFKCQLLYISFLWVYILNDEIKSVSIIAKQWKSNMVDPTVLRVLTGCCFCDCVCVLSCDWPMYGMSFYHLRIPPQNLSAISF